MRRSLRRNLVVFLAVLLCLIWTVAPVYWMINLSLMRGAERTAAPTHLYPHEPTLSNYTRILGFQWRDMSGELQPPSGHAGAVRRGLANSAIVATVATILTLVVAMPAAYSLGRLKFRIKESTLFSVIALRSTPDVTMVIPFFILFQLLGLYGNRIGIVVMHFSLTTPLITWVMMTMFEGLPKTVEQEARVDGCNWFQVFWRVIFPMALPGITAALCFTWVISWNEFTYGLLIAGGTRASTFPPLLSTLLAVEGGAPDYAAAWAAMVMGMMPSVVLAYIYQAQMRRLNVVSPF